MKLGIVLCVLLTVPRAPAPCDVRRSDSASDPTAVTAAAPPAALAALAARTASAPCAHQSAIDTLVNRYMAWRGGAAYERLTSIHERGRLEFAALTGTFDHYTARDGRERSEDSAGHLESSSALGPVGNWTGSQGVIEDMPVAAARDLRHAIAIAFGDALRGRDSATVTEVPDETRDGRRWAVLRVTFGGPDRYEAFLNRATGELLGWRITEDRVTHFTRFGDWRMVAGVRMPFRSEDLYENPGQNTVRRTDVLELNVSFSDSLFQRPESVRMAHFAPGRTETDALPFDLFDSNRIYIPARVNDHPVDLLLDSGAGTTVLDTRYADRIGVTAEGTSVVNGTGGQAGVAFAHDVRIEAGDMTLRVPTVLIIDLSGVEKLLGHPVPVILGADVFKQLIVDIDFGHRTIAFHDPARFTVPRGAVTVPLEPVADQRVLPVRIEGGPEVPMNFDLGNGGPLLIFPAYWQAHHMLDHRAASERMSGGVGGAHPEKVITVRSLTVAGVTFHDVPTVLTSARSNAVNGDRMLGNVGFPVYSRFRLMTDYPHDQLHLIPNAEGLHAPFARDRSGLSVVKDGSALRVELVSPGSPAAASGWKVGDVITAVNGHSIGDDDTGSALAHWNEGEAGETVTLRLADGTTRRLTLRDYY